MTKAPQPDLFAPPKPRPPRKRKPAGRDRLIPARQRRAAVALYAPPPTKPSP